MSQRIAKCAVCVSLLDGEDLFCGNCGTEAPRTSVPRDRSRITTHNFECSGCGASMSYDASAEGLRCPFCDSVELAPKPDRKVLSPRGIVPFSVEQDAAIRAMHVWMGKSFWRPGDLATQSAVIKMTPVYVPYWVFQAKTHAYWVADTTQTPYRARGDWSPLSGEHHGEHEGLLVGASGVLSTEETHQICPFDLASALPPERVDLDQMIVEDFRLPRKYARALARQGLEAREAAICDAQYVPGRSRNVHVNLRIEAMSSEPILLPVWIMAYRYRDRLYRFVVNGQTGRATGQAPVSKMKIGLAIAAGVGLFILLFVAALLAGVGA